MIYRVDTYVVDQPGWLNNEYELVHTPDKHYKEERDQSIVFEPIDPRKM